jgi:arsenate reductase (thioredoxin)
MKKFTAVFFLSVLSLCAEAQTGQKDISVVFVCEHGAGRSVIASRYFERLAREQGVHVNVSYRGISPDPSIGEVVKEELIKDGFHFADEKPVALSQQDIKDSDFVVTLDCSLPSGLDAADAKVLAYTGIPPPGNNFLIARDSLKKINVDVLTKLKSKK